MHSISYRGPVPEQEHDYIPNDVSWRTKTLLNLLQTVVLPVARKIIDEDFKGVARRELFFHPLFELFRIIEVGNKNVMTCSGKSVTAFVRSASLRAQSVTLAPRLASSTALARPIP